MQRNETISTSYFMHLPDEIILNILIYNDLNANLNMAATCKALRKVARDDVLWKGHVESISGSHHAPRVTFFNELLTSTKQRYAQISLEQKQILDLFKSGDLEAIERKGVSLDMLEGFPTNKACNPFYWAGVRKHQHILDYFYQCAKARYKKNDRVELLIWAVRCNQSLDVFKSIYADIMKSHDVSLLVEAIVSAIECGHSGALRALHDLGLKLNIALTSQYGEKLTPLFIATKLGQTEVVRELLTIPGVKANIKPEENMSVLHMAAIYGQSETLAQLLTYPDIRKQINLVKCERVYHPTHPAISYDVDIGTALYLVLSAYCAIRQQPDAESKILNVVRELLKTPEIDVNVKCWGEETALHMAASKGQVEVVRELLNAPNINVRIKNRHNKTPLDVVKGTSQQKEEIEYLLLKAEKLSEQLEGYRKERFNDSREYKHQVSLFGKKILNRGCSKQQEMEGIQMLMDRLDHPESKVAWSEFEKKYPALSENELGEFCKKVKRYLQLQEKFEQGEKRVKPK